MIDQPDTPISALVLADRLASGAICPVALTEATLARIRAADPAIFTELLEERALREAHASRARRRAGAPLGPWDGIPVAWKDLFDIKGRVTTAGSVVLRDQAPARRDADIVAHAARAGLISVGCLNMTEFAYSGLGLNPHYGTPVNPRGPARATGLARIPGGSSSGCGVAVASGLVPLAVGTDTGGSVRIPAALNGVAGFKGSAWAFPAGGLFSLSTSLDTIGPLAADLDSCIGAAEVLNGRKPVLPPHRPLAGLQFLIPSNVVFDDLQPAVRDNFEACVRLLQRAGAQVDRAVFPVFDEIGALSAHGYLVGPEALDQHWDRLHSDAAAQMDPRIVARLLDAGAMSARDLVLLRRERERLIAQSRQALGARIVLYPTTPVTAPALAPLERDDAAYLRMNRLMLRNTALGNFLDWCGVSLPSGADQDGLPTGLLMSMPGGHEAALLAAARSVETAISPLSANVHRRT